MKPLIKRVGRYEWEDSKGIEIEWGLHGWNCTWRVSEGHANKLAETHSPAELIARGFESAMFNVASCEQGAWSVTGIYYRITRPIRRWWRKLWK